MSPVRHPSGEFTEARERATRERDEQRVRAIRTVTGRARDRDDLASLLSALGLDEPGSGQLGPRLAGYVRQVATAVGVPAEATGYEVSDTATAYLGLNVRCFVRPGRDLMLVWDERLGWSVGVEPRPGEPPVVLAFLGGADAVPAPSAVARFVTDTVTGGITADTGHDCARPEFARTDRAQLADRMAAHRSA